MTGQNTASAMALAKEMIRMLQKDVQPPSNNSMNTQTDPNPIEPEQVAEEMGR